MAHPIFQRFGKSSKKSNDENNLNLINQNNKNYASSSRNFLKDNIKKIHANLHSTLNSDVFRLQSKISKAKKDKKIISQKHHISGNLSMQIPFKKQLTERLLNQVHVTQFNAGLFLAQTERVEPKYRRIETKNSRRKSLKNLKDNRNQKIFFKIKTNTACDEQKTIQTPKVQTNQINTLTIIQANKLFMRKYDRIQTSMDPSRQKYIFKVTGLKAPIAQIADYYKIKTISKKLDTNFNNQKIRKSLTLSGYKCYSKLL